MIPRILTVILLLSGLAGTAAAATLKYRGEFRTRGVYVLNKDLNRDTLADVAMIDTRLRFWLMPEVNENLRLVYGLQIGDISWGDPGVVQENTPLSGPQTAINLQSIELYMQYGSSRSTEFSIGFIPFATPSPLVLDSTLPALQFRFPLAGPLFMTLLYARAWSGPFLSDDTPSSPAESDRMNLSNDRNDYFASLEMHFSEKTKLSAWILFDDNNRYKHEAPGIKLLATHLFYFGLHFSGADDDLAYHADLIINSGVITSFGEGQESVAAWALQGGLRYDTSFAGFAAQALITSGNTYDDSEPGNSVKQFHTLDGNQGAKGSWLSLLFGGSPFNQQSLFNAGTAGARSLNSSLGYFVRNDPGITSIEFMMEKEVDEGGARFRLILGAAMTSRALLDRTGTEARMLGVEFDVGLRIPLAEGVRLELQMAYLFPGAALGPALELDGAVLGRPYFGGDPAFKADTGLIFTF